MEDTLRLTSYDALARVFAGELPAFAGHVTDDAQLRHLENARRAARHRLEAPDQVTDALRELSSYVRLAAGSLLPLDHPLLSPGLARMERALAALRRSELIDDELLEMCRTACAALLKDPRNALSELLETFHATLGGQVAMLVPNRLRADASAVANTIDQRFGRAFMPVLRSRLHALPVGSTVLVAGDIALQFAFHPHLLSLPLRFELLSHAWQRQTIGNVPHLARSARHIQRSLQCAEMPAGVIDRQPEVQRRDLRTDPDQDWMVVTHHELHEHHNEADDFKVAEGDTIVSAVRIELGGRHLVFFDQEGWRRVVVPRWISGPRMNAVKLVPVAEIEPGMLWAQSTGGDDIIDLLRDEPTYRAWWKTTLIWKTALQERLAANENSIIKAIAFFGCSEDHVRANARAWAGPNRILPRGHRTFLAILKALGLEADVDDFWQAGRELQIAHQSTGLHQHKYQLETIRPEDEEAIRRDGYVVLDPDGANEGLAVYEIEEVDDRPRSIPERLLNRIFSREGD